MEKTIITLFSSKGEEADFDCGFKTRIRKIQPRDDYRGFRIVYYGGHAASDSHRDLSRKELLKVLRVLERGYRQCFGETLILSQEFLNSEFNICSDDWDSLSLDGACVSDAWSFYSGEENQVDRGFVYQKLDEVREMTEKFGFSLRFDEPWRENTSTSVRGERGYLGSYDLLSSSAEKLALLNSREMAYAVLSEFRQRHQREGELDFRRYRFHIDFASVRISFIDKELMEDIEVLWSFEIPSPAVEGIMIPTIEEFSRIVELIEARKYDELVVTDRRPVRVVDYDLIKTGRQYGFVIDESDRVDSTYRSRGDLLRAYDDFIEAVEGISVVPDFGRDYLESGRVYERHQSQVDEKVFVLRAIKWWAKEDVTKASLAWRMFSRLTDIHREEQLSSRAALEFIEDFCQSF